jgi:glutamate dehydrogenase
MENHPLRREIVATQISNILVETMGASFLYRLREETGAREQDIVSAFWAAWQLIAQTKIFEILHAMDNSTSAGSHAKTLLTVADALEAMIRWLLENHDPASTWTQILAEYQVPFLVLLSKAPEYLTQTEEIRRKERADKFLTAHVPDEAIDIAATLPYLEGILDVIAISHEVKQDEIELARLYTQLAQELHLSPLMEHVGAIDPETRWEDIAQDRLSASFRSSVGILTRLAAKDFNGDWEETRQSFVTKNSTPIRRFGQTVKSVLADPPNIAALMVVAQDLREIADRN